MSEFKDIKKILVIKLRNIGDVLLCVPAIRALKETFPSASISALVNSGTEEMLTLNPLLDDVIPFKREIKGRTLAGRAAGELAFLQGLRKKRFDMTVDLTGGDRAALAGLFIGARYRLGYDPEGGGFMGKRFLYTHLAKKPAHGTHTVLRDLLLVKEFGIDTGDLTVNIYTSPEDDAHVEKALAENGLKPPEPFVHVHPASRWLFKCWTDEGMAYVMDKLSEEGLKAVVTSGPAEKELKKVRSIKGLMKSAPVDLSGRLTLKQMASLSRLSCLFFGVDSAPMHIAAAAGVRVAAIFGPSGAFDWGPWDNIAIRKCGPYLLSGPKDGSGRNSPYPQKGGVQYFGGNVVIQRNWDCVPCGKDGCNGSKKSDCLDSIDPASAWKVIKEILGKDSRCAAAPGITTGMGTAGWGQTS